MNNKDKMLRLVLSDEKLCKLYEYNLEDFRYPSYKVHIALDRIRL